MHAMHKRALTTHLRTACATAALLALAGSGRALAWGHTGHVEMGEAAIASLPAEIPAFVRTASAIRTVGELSAEADVSKSSGQIHDFERDSGHYIDLDENGNVLSLSGLPLSALLVPNQGRRDYDTLLRGLTVTAARPVGASTQYDGYLPFNMVDGYQQVRKDFAYIRAFTAAIANPATAAADRAFFQLQLQLRQTLTLRDIGYWSHFVEDASQPGHVSIHFTGWGNYPNPNNYTLVNIHPPFEGAFVKRNVSVADITARIGAYVPGNGIETRVRNYLAATLTQVVPMFQVAGNPANAAAAFPGSDPAQVAFARGRVAAGAQELRDQIVDAWRESDAISVGFDPALRTQVTPAAISSGAVVWTANGFAGD